MKESLEYDTTGQVVLLPMLFESTFESGGEGREGEEGRVKGGAGLEGRARS